VNFAAICNGLVYLHELVCYGSARQTKLADCHAMHSPSYCKELEFPSFNWYLY